MILLLFIFCSILTCLSYLNGGRNLIRPSLIVCAMFSISSLYYALNLDLIGIDISFTTLFVIVTGLIAWCFCESVACRVVKNNTNYIEYKTSPYNVRLYFILLACVISVLVVYGDYRNFMAIGDYLGGDNVFLAYSLNRNYQNMGDDVAELNKPRILKIFELLSVAINYILVYYYIYNWKICGKHMSVLLLPFIISLPTLFFSTARQSFVQPVVYILILAIAASYIYECKRIVNRRYLKMLGILFLVAILLFKVTGELRGGNRIEEKEGFFESLSTLNKDLTVYLASPIRGLDYFLVGNYSYDSSFGNNTLAGLFDTLRFIGLNVKASNVNTQADFYIAGSSSNVYTGFKGCIEDFSVLFYIPYVSLIGYFCGKLFNCLSFFHDKDKLIYLVIAGRVYTTIFLFYFSSIFHVYLSPTFLIFLFFVILIKKNQKYILNKE